MLNVLKMNKNKIKSKAGSSLVESMIAITIFSVSALAVFPVFIASNKNATQADGRSLCQTVVQKKLDEYRNGRMVDPNDVAQQLYDMYAAANPTLTQTQLQSAQKNIYADVSGAISGLSYGAMSTSVTNQTTGGFFYAKSRYNLFYPESCKGVGTAALFAKLGIANPVYGMRECVGSNKAWDEENTSASIDQCGVTSSTDSEDKRISGQLPNFKLYVKLELSTPWLLKIDSGSYSNKEAQYSDTCPDFGSWANGSYSYNPNALKYDFDGAGDGIKITVTGVIDASTDGTGRSLASIQDPHQLICQASGVVKPQSYPIRYFLSRLERRIFTVHGSTTNGAANSSYVFENLYKNASDTQMLSGIDAFSVHPRNLSIWVLNAGVLTRYGNCGGVPITCSNDPSGQKAIGDIPDTEGDPALAETNTYSARYDVQTFHLPTSISSIGINYKTGAVYGFSPGTGMDGAYEIRCASQPTKTLAFCTAQNYDETELSFSQPTSARLVSQISTTSSATGNARIEQMFLSHDGEELYLTSNDYNSVLGEAYTQSIYRAEDTSHMLPLMRLPFDVLGLSK